MKKRLSLSIILAVALGVIAAQSQTPKAPSSVPTVNSAAAAEIRVIDLDGLKKLLQRDANEPRPLLVNFWASWCDGCREEFPDLVKIDQDYRARGLNFLSVTVDELEDKAQAASFIEEMKAKMPVVLLNVADKEPAIHAIDMNWDGALPATFIYDKNGTVSYRHFGKISPAELRTAIDKQLGTKQ
ncbi:MAG TPA: TlpA disulfide reductase family protein [Pyrinomonadaceae bacterium]|nr:TlpA disulfide reductase family protein [Pyrinomonadaceae bacterium]